MLNTFLTTSDEVEKYFELVHKSEAKIMKQSSSCDDCVRIYNFKILSPLDPELQLINTKSTAKSKLKYLPKEIKNFKIQPTLVLDYKKIDDHDSTSKNLLFKYCILTTKTIRHHHTKLIMNDSGIDEAFRSIHQSVMTMLEHFVIKNWIAKTIMERIFNILEYM